MMKDNHIKRLCERVKGASRKLALVDTKTKNRALHAMSGALKENSARILKANDRDLRRALARKAGRPFVDRLTLTRKSIAAMSHSLEEIAGLKDPVGAVIESRARPNGLKIAKVRVPIGVILIIYESRPNVTADCIALCLKSSNAVILRGGSEAINSNIAIYESMARAAGKVKGFPVDSIAFIRDIDRRILGRLLAATGLIDLVIPRGGESLINEVSRRSKIPVIRHYKGVCHTYVDDSADLGMAARVCFNAKVQRPGVCNAMETMLVNERVADRFLPAIIGDFIKAGVEIRGCPATRCIAGGVRPAKESDYYTEYLDLKLSVRVVKDVGEAIAHITKYGSGHSDAIITRNRKRAEKFLREVDSACVYANTSTRFTDGGEFGMGAEMGISTDKIHARGPMGLKELTSYKYVIYGNGQTRK